MLVVKRRITVTLTRSVTKNRLWLATIFLEPVSRQKHTALFVRKTANPVWSAFISITAQRAVIAARSVQLQGLALAIQTAKARPSLPNVKISVMAASFVCFLVVHQRHAQMGRHVRILEITRNFALPPNSIEGLHEETGKTESKSLRSLGGGKAILEVKLAAGDPFLFKYDTSRPFSLQK